MKALLLAGIAAFLVAAVSAQAAQPAPPDGSCTRDKGTKTCVTRVTTGGITTNIQPVLTNGGPTPCLLPDGSIGQLYAQETTIFSQDEVTTTTTTKGNKTTTTTTTTTTENYRIEQQRTEYHCN